MKKLRRRFTVVLFAGLATLALLQMSGASANCSIGETSALQFPAQCCKSSSETGRSIQIEVDAFAELYSKHCINSAIPSVLQAAAWFYSPQKPASARFLHAYAPLLAKPSVRPIATATHGSKNSLIYHLQRLLR